jgi:hypothetical protein
MTPSDVASARLRHQHIAHPAASSIRDVVAHLGGMQAQDYNGALWAIGLRRPDVTEAEVEQAVAAREIIAPGLCAAPCTSSPPPTCAGCSSC